MLRNLNKYDVVLASGSPRRRELLAGLGVRFRVEVRDDIEEVVPKGMLAMQVAEHLSRLKAQAYRPDGNQLIITADTIVIGPHGEVMGKPHDEADARAMLQMLSGATHSVVTGVTVHTAQRLQSFSAQTQVEFDTLSDEEIDHYIENYRPMDKAGAYGIQEWIGYIGVRGIQGSFYNVMGLPVQRLYTLLKTF